MLHNICQAIIKSQFSYPLDDSVSVRDRTGDIIDQRIYIYIYIIFFHQKVIKPAEEVVEGALAVHLLPRPGNQESFIFSSSVYLPTMKE